MMKLIIVHLLIPLILISSVCLAEEGKKMRVVYKIIDYSPIVKIDNLYGFAVEKQEPFEYVPLRSNTGQSSVWQRDINEKPPIETYNSKYKAQLKVLSDFSEIDKVYQFDVTTLDAKLRKYLEKHGIAFVTEKEDATLEIIFESLSFDSLGGYFINEVKYRVTRNDQKLFAGMFGQEMHCSGLSTVLRGKCSGGYIGKFLAKDIVSKLKLLKGKGNYSPPQAAVIK